MLSKEKQMDVLEAYDLTKSLRAAAELTGVDHHTVARYVAARAAGQPFQEGALERATKSDAFADKIAEWVDRSNGKVRADVVHDRLVAMGYTGSERTTRRVVAILKTAYRRPAPSDLSALDPRTGPVAPIRLRRRPGGRRGQDGAVLRLAGLEPLPGDHRPARSHHALGGVRPRPRRCALIGGAPRPTC